MENSIPNPNPMFVSIAWFRHNKERLIASVAKAECLSERAVSLVVHELYCDALLPSFALSPSDFERELSASIKKRAEEDRHALFQWYLSDLAYTDVSALIAARTSLSVPLVRSYVTRMLMDLSAPKEIDTCAPIASPEYTAAFVDLAAKYALAQHAASPIVLPEVVLQCAPPPSVVAIRINKRKAQWAALPRRIMPARAAKMARK